MSPIRPFTHARAGVTEVSIWRSGVPTPRLGDRIERDGEFVRVTRVSYRSPTADDLSVWKDSLRPALGDYILTIEYEYLPDEPVAVTVAVNGEAEP